MTELNDAFLDSVIPVRPRDAHKGHFGRLLILAGSTGYSGAAQLCGAAAVRTGAGLCRMGLPGPVWPVVAGALPECMCFPLPADEKGRIHREAFPWIREELRKCGACVCGPGLGQSEALRELIVLLQNSGKSLLLDADGINNTEGHILNCPLVLTPHEGEFLRLGGCMDAGSVQGGQDFVREHPCVLVLKGAETLIFSPGAEPFRLHAPNPGLAAGGSGDVLAGIIGSLLAQGLPLPEAAAAGVLIHSRAAALCAAAIGEYGMTPSDVIAAIPRVLRRFNG